jgi:hypothetical protein
MFCYKASVAIKNAIFPFTYTFEKGIEIELGSKWKNDLTSKISCFGNLTNLTKYYSINVNGVESEVSYLR